MSKGLNAEGGFSFKQKREAHAAVEWDFLFMRRRADKVKGLGFRVRV